jgi:hypothetical protein
MRRRRKLTEVVEPSLVPMVDLLSNTVGALVFIMIFTVMAASGVVVLKRLPLEHSSSAKPANFLCENDRIYPLDHEELHSKLMSRWGRPTSLFDVYSWIARYDGIEVEDDHFVARGESRVTYSTYSISTLYTPKAGGGYSKHEIQDPNSAFRRRLAGLNPKLTFAHFFVRPDSIDSFLVARRIATEEMNFGTGWMPLDTSEPLRFVSRGQGRAATEQ